MNKPNGFLQLIKRSIFYKIIKTVFTVFQQSFSFNIFSLKLYFCNLVILYYSLQAILTGIKLTGLEYFGH